MVQLGAAFAGVGMVKSMISLATSAEETADKFKSVFGPAADEMNTKIEKLKETIPATTKELQDASAIFGLMAQSFGLNSRASEDFSVNMVRIAGDLASFHDIDPALAFEKLRAGIVGSSEPLQALGIDTREAALKQEALNMGIWDGVGALSNSQKAMAVQSAVINQMGAASGNAALTINSTANQIKFLVRGLSEAGTTIGTAILPIIQDFAEGVKIIGEGISALKGNEGIEKVVNDFEAMAKANLDARGELEITKKVMGSKIGAVFVDDIEAIQRNQAKIADRAKELEASYNALNEETKNIVINTNEKSEADDAILAANESLLENLREQIKQQGVFTAQQKIVTEEIAKSKELNDKIKQIKLAIARAEASGNKDAVDSLNKRLELAGRILKIMKQTGASREEATRLAGAGAGSKSSNSADSNKSVIVTGREQRAKEAADRKAATDARRAKTLEVAGESGAGERARDQGRNQRFDSREAAAGLNLAGNDPTAGRKPIEEEAKKQTESLNLISNTLSKLESALGSE